MSSDFKDARVDPESAQKLAASGLRLGLVDTDDFAAFSAWLDSDARGFHDSRPSKELVASQMRGVGYRRTTGVWDATSAHPASPVATVSAWPAELTVPGATSVTAWAISSVTVAPTHRRKGVARALLEAELRTALHLGVPVAMLTVSEATIYGRYGFAPAAMAADWKIDSRRARWAGPEASGRVQFIELEQLRTDAPAIAERVRLSTPGEIEIWDYLWDRMLGLESDDKELAKTTRTVRYDDADGVAQGFAVYRVKDSGTDFTAHPLELHYLVSATDDAYAGLWRFLLEVDLVGTITAPLRSVDEPVVWQLSDFRAAVKAEEHDHLWLRILDVKAALEQRRYFAPTHMILSIDDELGFADGQVLLEVSSGGAAIVTPHAGRVPDGAAGLSLRVNELSALYLGGVSARSLVRAGRIRELVPGSADQLDSAFRSPVAPWLSIWF